MATFTFKLIDTYNDSYTVVRLSQPKPLGHKHEDLKKYSLTTGASTQRPNFSNTHIGAQQQPAKPILQYNQQAIVRVKQKYGFAPVRLLL
jgi:hypothetical protein